MLQTREVILFSKTFKFTEEEEEKCCKPCGITCTSGTRHCYASVFLVCGGFFVTCAPLQLQVAIGAKVNYRDT